MKKTTTQAKAQPTTKVMAPDILQVTDHDKVAYNLPSISAQEIHANNLRAFRIGNRARHALNEGLRALYDGELFLSLGSTSITQYAEEHFDFSRSQTYHSIRVARALRVLPLCDRTFRDGEISWTAIREIT